jgi:hypothetical protein
VPYICTSLAIGAKWQLRVEVKVDVAFGNLT